ncbi:hypothetical protein D1BOALGB6SA_10836 [Olavius sp. associated proteobacterium Delta 1]|nr:hypothetical protein D1BOALGB6SA_10836 [Olavius sp. associated proteobacterium Delta 1]
MHRQPSAGKLHKGPRCSLFSWIGSGPKILLNLCKNNAMEWNSVGLKSSGGA